jgi:uncharacterized iron-regulated membrane protein
LPETAVPLLPTEKIASRQPASARRRRIRPRQLLAKAHRWSSFGLGLLLLVVVFSGAVILFAPEIEQVTHPSLYESANGPVRVTPGEALATVRRELPGFQLTGAEVVENRGAWEVHDEDAHVARVDSTSGELLGTIKRESGVIGFLENLHMCALGCEGMPGYVPFLAKPAQVDGFDLSFGNEGTWGGTILAVTALLLLALSISGLVLWWPGRKKVRRGFKVRRGAGTYKLNYDLHKVVGFVALPFLLMWAITGTMFELPKQADAVWYALTPGEAAPEVEFESKPVKGESVPMSEAIRIGRGEVPSGSRLVSINNPSRSEPTSSYLLWFSHGVDPYRFGTYPGNYGLYVDRYSGRSQVFWPDSPDRTLAAGFWQDWTGPLHFGYVVGWIPRLGWLAFGLTPLLLAVTGTTTWLLRRRKRRRKGPGGPSGPALAT